MPVLSEVLSTPDHDGIVIKSNAGTSEDAKQKTWDISFRKKAMNASRKLRHTLRRRGKRATDRQRAAIIIHDVRYVEEEKADHSLPSKELAFHEYLSTSICGITRTEVAAAKGNFIQKSALRKSKKNFISYVTSSLLHWILTILEYMELLFQWLWRAIMVICADRKSKNQYMSPSTESESQVNCTYAELDDLLWKKLLYLESLVMELYSAENHPEEEDMFLESINRIICIEYDLQKTEKALRSTASKQVELNESLEYFMESSLTYKERRANLDWKLLQQMGVLNSNRLLQLSIKQQSQFYLHKDSLMIPSWTTRQYFFSIHHRRILHSFYKSCVCIMLRSLKRLRSYRATNHLKYSN